MDAPWHEYQLPGSGERRDLRQQDTRGDHTAAQKRGNSSNSRLASCLISHRSNDRLPASLNFYNSQNIHVMLSRTLDVVVFISTIMLLSSSGGRLRSYESQGMDERNLFKYKVSKVSKGSMIYWWKIPWSTLYRAIRCIVSCRTRSWTTQINDNELSQRESNVGNHRHHYSNGYHARHVQLYVSVTLFICDIYLTASLH